jgi:hypothetical protein
LNNQLNLKYKIRSDLITIDIQCFESLFIQLDGRDSKTKDIIIGVVYKPPNTDLDVFNTQFGEVLNVLAKEKKPCYILGDYNINLLKFQTHLPIGDFINTILSNGFYQLIDKPTRITLNSATLIDNILTNVHSEKLSPAIWLTDISDHLPVLVTIPSKKSLPNMKSSETFTHKHIINDLKIEQFRSDINNHDWSTVFSSNSTEQIYHIFENNLKELYEKKFLWLGLDSNLVIITVHGSQKD